MRRQTRLAALGMLAGFGLAFAQNEAARSIGEAEAKVRELQGTFDAGAAEYTGVYNDARSIKFDVKVAFTGSAHLSPLGPPEAFGQLTYQDMLEYMPGALIDDINWRIYQEYLRGYHEWEYGYYPPVRYMRYDSTDLYGNPVWVHALYDQWDEDVQLIWNIPPSPWGLYVSKRGGRGGTGADIRAQIASLAPLKERAQQAINATRSYRPQVQVRSWRTDLWTNKADWDRLQAAADGAMRDYRNGLDRVRVAVDSECRGVVEQVVHYQKGRDNMPVLEFILLSRMGTGTGLGGPDYGGLGGTGTGTGDGYNNGIYRPGYGMNPPRYLNGDQLLAWYFDNMFLSNLPDGYSEIVEKKFAQAYFRGAYNAKYAMGISGSAGSGSGYSYGWRDTWSSSGTGNGYSYGGDRYRSSSGRRTPGTAHGTGDGSVGGTSGTGNGTSSPSGTGTGSGQTNPYGTGTGGGQTYPSGTGTGGGQVNPSGTGTGSTYTPPRPTGTGTGSGTPQPSGTGTGSGGGNPPRPTSSTGTGT